MKYFYICVAEFEADEELTKLPELYFPNIKEGSLICKQSIEPVEEDPFKFYRTIIKNCIEEDIIKNTHPESEYVKTYLDLEPLCNNLEEGSLYNNFEEGA